MEGVVNTSDLAHELGVTRETIVRHINDGNIPGAFRRLGRWRIPVEDAEAFASSYGGGTAYEPDDDVDEEEDFGYEEEEEYDD